MSIYMHECIVNKTTIKMKNEYVFFILFQYVPAKNNRAVIANKIRFYTYLTLTTAEMRAPALWGSALFINKVSGEGIS